MVNDRSWDSDIMSGEPATMPKRQQPVYKYEYRSDEAGMSKKFKCNLQCYRCAAQTGRGAQCTRKVCIGLPYCAQHMRSMLSLEIRPSDIPGAGLGVFAIRRIAKASKLVFHEGDEIAEYFGECLTTQEHSKRYGSEQYGLGVYSYDDDAGNTIDASCARSVASMINSHPNHHNCEAEILTDEKGPGGCHIIRIVATEDIKDGEELLLNYGERYFSGADQNIKYSTSNVPRFKNRKRRTIREPVARGERVIREKKSPRDRKTRTRYTFEQRRERKEEKERQAQERRDQRANRPPKERKKRSPNLSPILYSAPTPVPQQIYSLLPSTAKPARQKRRRQTAKPTERQNKSPSLNLLPVRLPAQTPGLQHYGLRSQQPYNLRPSTAEQLSAKPMRRRRRRQTAESKRAKPARMTKRKRSSNAKPRHLRRFHM